MAQTRRFRPFTIGTWMSTLMMGSVLSWSLGMIVVAMSLAMLQKDVFFPEVIDFLMPLYQSLIAAAACGFLICFASLLGCFSSCCVYRSLLYTHLVAMFIITLYQLGDGAALIYYGNELFTVVQYISIELCLGESLRPNDRRGRSFDHRERIQEVVERVAKSMKDKTVLRPGQETVPDSIKKLIQQYDKEGYTIRCAPVKDFATPIGALLVFTSLVNLCMAYSTFVLIRNYHEKRKNQTDTRSLREIVDEDQTKSNGDVRGNKDALANRSNCLYSSSTGTSCEESPFVPPSVNRGYNYHTDDLRPMVSYYSPSSSVYQTPTGAGFISLHAGGEKSPVVTPVPNASSAEVETFSYDLHGKKGHYHVSKATPRPRPTPKLSEVSDSGSIPPPHISPLKLVKPSLNSRPSTPSKKQQATPSKPEKSPMKLNNTPSKPEHTPMKLDNTPSKPEHTPMKLDNTPSKPENTPMKLDNTPTKPDHTPKKLDKTPSKPEHTPKKLSKTPSKPEHTPKKLSKTPSKPEHTPMKLNNTPAKPEKSPMKLNNLLLNSISSTPAIVVQTATPEKIANGQLTEQKTDP